MKNTHPSPGGYLNFAFCFLTFNFFLYAACHFGRKICHPQIVVTPYNPKNKSSKTTQNPSEITKNRQKLSKISQILPPAIHKYQFLTKSNLFLTKNHPLLTRNDQTQISPNNEKRAKKISTPNFSIRLNQLPTPPTPEPGQPNGPS